MTRRSPGEGTVYQRSDGRWVAAVQLPNDHLGRRRRRKRTVKTKKEAERICRNLLADIESGRIELDGSITVTDWCETWLTGAARLTCKERTVAGYKYTLDRYVLPHVGRYQLRHLHVGELVRRRRHQGIPEGRFELLAADLLVRVGVTEDFEELLQRRHTYDSTTIRYSHRSEARPARC